MQLLLSWSNINNNTPLFRDAENENLYYYEGKFNVGAIKLLEILGEWQPQWGIKDGNFTNSTILGGDPDGINVTTAGFYKLTVNVDEMTYTFTEIDASNAATYTTIGLVGEGTSVGWPNEDNPTPDIELTKSTFNEHIWYAQNVTLTEGSIKFRAEKAWDVNWGAGTFPSGQGTFGGPDIPAMEGTYNVWFNDLT
ncbi:SusF/SusE family outer membrane protein [Antarcticibacterium sp. 1MA-6-2]|nr:SusF/SusE family outer membrane protein [Antarcticibacterium sp. 1MA-6-2]UJH92946.1 SusF/SusE family outer membrane protein [Antarcticibacterium sp. 1MA-6-2]